MLITRGFISLESVGGWWLALPAFLLGSLKSRFILDKSARSGIARILQFRDGTCLGAVYSVRTWLLVLVMIFMGIEIRRSSISPFLIGFMYIAIGWALFYSSRFAWRVWWKEKKKYY